MEKNIEEKRSTLILCPLCKLNVPLIVSLKYSHYQPKPAILLKCPCSLHIISLISIYLIYSKKDNCVKPNEIKDEKYIQLTLILNEIQELFNRIIENLDLSNDNVRSNNKTNAMEIQKNFNYIFIEVNELYQKLLIDALKKNASANTIANYQGFTFNSILEYKASLLQIANKLKDKEKTHSISDLLNKIKSIKNSFIKSTIKEEKRYQKHLYWSSGGWKVMVKWKISHFAKQKFYLSGHNDSVECICEMRNGNIVTCGYDKKIQIWDRSKMSVIKVLKGHSKPVLTVVSLENGMLASGSSDNSIRLWNPNKESCVKVLEGHLGNVIKLIQLSNRLLVSCSGDTSLCVWNLEKEEHFFLNGHELTVESVDELSNEQGNIFIASCSLDRRILIWDLTNESIVKSLADENIKPLICLCKLNDGNILAGSQSQMYVWNWKESHLVSKIDKGAYCFSQLSNNMIITGSNDNCVKIFSYPNMDLIMKLCGHTCTVISVSILTDGSIISSSWDSQFAIWE